MTIKEKEEFIAVHFENFPFITSGHYNVRWIIQVNKDLTSFKLYEDTEYEDHPTVTSQDKNFAITYYVRSDNGDVPRVFLFDVTDLFMNNNSFYSCLNNAVSVGSCPNHSFSHYHLTEDQHYFDGPAEIYNILCDSVFVGASIHYALDENNLGFYAVHSGVPSSTSSYTDLMWEQYSKSYDTLDKAYSAYLDNSYTNNKLDPIRQTFKLYLDCLRNRVFKCCLEWC